MQYGLVHALGKPPYLERDQTERLQLSSSIIGLKKKPKVWAPKPTPHALAQKPAGDDIPTVKYPGF